MTRRLRVVHYLNQFFGQIGGEDKADAPLCVRDKAVGPGLALNAALGEAASVVGTVICGDNTMAENLEENAREAAKAIAALEPDLLIAGPAFGAGRYGMACGAVCKALRELLPVPAVAGLHESNPAVGLYRSYAHLVPTGPSAVGMRAAVPAMASLGLRLCLGEKPEPGSYIPQGVRASIRREKTGAERAAAMLAARLRGEEPETELPLPSYESVPPAPPLDNLASAVIVLATEGGLSPKGNPDRLEASMATKFGVYSIEGLEALTPDAFQASHGGYDNSQVNADLHRLVPLDAMRALEREGVIGSVAPVLYSTAGNATTLENAERFGREIALDIRERFKDQAGVFLTAT